MKYCVRVHFVADKWQRASLIGVLTKIAELLEPNKACKQYIVHADDNDLDSVWVIEMWDSKQARDAWFEPKEIRDLALSALPMLYAEPKQFELTTFVGKGLKATEASRTQ